ncbi:MAG: FtsQ-type POTRA domain-containing protein [Clostridia bacterium]|nr:FtsQ-type POTRA domain-containing protein [Clostridia bacterium]
MKKKRRRAKNRLKLLLGIAGLALILMLLLFAPVFDIHAIVVTGSTRYTPDKIKEVSGIVLNENGFRKLPLKPEAILGLRLTDSENKIRRLPYVKDCTVRLVFPDRVKISITEREPAAYLSYLDNYLIVDSEGFVLESRTEPPQGNLKEIQGIEFSKYTLGGQLEASDIELIKTAVEIMRAVSESDKRSEFKLNDVLDYIDMVDRNNALLSLDHRITVHLNPKDKLQYTIDFTKEIFFKNTGTNQTGKIDFTSGENPGFSPE